MQKSNKIILFDIDYTLFNTDLYLDNLYVHLTKELGYSLEDFYELAKQTSDYTRKTMGHFEPVLYLETLLKSSKRRTTIEALNTIFFDNNFYEKSIYPEVIGIFSELKKSGTETGIFSRGDLEHQKLKIKALRKYLSDHHVYIAIDKLKIVKATFENYKNQNAFLVDDLPIILSEVKKHHKNVFTIWIKRDKKYGTTEIPEDFKPDATIHDLRQILDLVRDN